MARRCRQAQRGERARARQEALLGILRVQAQFDGVAVGRYALVADQRAGQGLARGHAQLQFDEVEPEGHFGDRMLHLQARVDLHEVEIAALPDDEFHCSGIHVAERAARRHGGFTHARTQIGREEGRRRLLQDLLVAALRRALTLVEMHQVAVAVAEDLELDVARPFDVAFQQHPFATEGVLRLALAGLQVGGELRRRAHDAHALAAAAVRRLDHERIADAVGLALQQARVLLLAGVAGHDRHAVRGHQQLRAGLGAHLAHRGCGRADEGQAGCLDRIGEIRVFRQEAVAGMDGLGAAAPRHVEDGLAAQVGIGGPRAADRPGLVRLAHVLGRGVCLGVDRHRTDAETAAGAGDAAGDLAAVGNEDLGKHQASPSQ